MSRLLLQIVLSVSIACSARAQVLYGSLTGNVTDPSSASVPNANVEATNTNTGAKRAVMTDSVGIYSFSNLQPGTYKITVTANGFQTATEQNLGIEANQVRRAD